MACFFDVIRKSSHSSTLIAYDARWDMVKLAVIVVGGWAIFHGSLAYALGKTCNIQAERLQEMQKNFLIYTIDMVALAVMSVLNLYITIPLSVGVPLLASVVFLPRLIANYVYPQKKAAV